MADESLSKIPNLQTIPYVNFLPILTFIYNEVASISGWC